ncbi:MAG: sensor histidine kinase [endosymbiont of Galathealinum brachiosum]|uniref:histidine kinase n=1 Tax=endosymbiont of Galathealinum brachiosum TaxID=2200906 RepID=A0A370DLI3_9GAMM|nr:MAG: sensor histidine kinase [endosymbiont of Galathealinum brachiosum]
MKTSFIHTLYFKMAAGLGLILLVVGLSYTIFASYMLQQINQSSLQLINHNLALNLVNDKKIVHDGKIDKKAMKETFMQYMTINPSIEIYYLDLNGNILAYSAEPGKVKRNSINLNPVRQRIEKPEQLNILGDDPRSHETKKSFSVTAIPDKSNPEGYLYVVLQGEELTKAINTQSQNTIIYLGGMVLTGSLLMGLLLGLFLFYRITYRIKNLQENVANFVSNDFSSASTSGFCVSNLIIPDEISELEKYIARMTLHIHKQWSALKQQDNLRREMVANISHDLRTPLASIQGYLETLTIKYDNLSDNDRKKYLKTTSKQANSLQKLIDGLFELAKLDAREHQPIMESFPVLELVYDVLAKFEINTQKKNIKLNIISETDNPVVLADIGLIERVLDNLINNAIYYSNTNGHITVSIAAPEDGSLTVKVIDTGQGIPVEQQALVFEQFHQAHTPERKDGHAGLGLCIVKKIIELHKQKVWVESKPEQGAEFNFTLAIA